MDAPEREVTYPGPDESVGVATTFIGGIIIDPANREILASPRLGCSREEHDKLLRKATHDRDHTDLGLEGASPETISALTLPIDVSGDLVTKKRVVRCGVLGCDQFMGWHQASTRDESVVGEHHVTSDLGTEYFRCRLIYARGRWVLDVGMKAGAHNNPTAAAMALSKATMLLAAAAEELNEVESLSS